MRLIHAIGICYRRLFLCGQTARWFKSMGDLSSNREIVFTLNGLRSNPTPIRNLAIHHILLKSTSNKYYTWDWCHITCLEGNGVDIGQPGVKATKAAACVPLLSSSCLILFQRGAGRASSGRKQPLRVHQRRCAPTCFKDEERCSLV